MERKTWCLWHVHDLMHNPTLQCAAFYRCENQQSDYTTPVSDDTKLIK